MRNIIIATSLFGTVFFFQNCSKTPVSFAPTAELASELEEAAINYLPEKQLLVYGESSSDRNFLAQKMAGYQAPGMEQVVNQWRRIAGDQIYDHASDIVPEPEAAHCFTSLDANGNWLPATSPTGSKIPNPGVSGVCIGSSAFAASSWSYLPATNRLHNATNAAKFNGFISGLRFDKYTHQAVVTSTSTDDDTIGIIIAATVDDLGNIHTLTASRTQGGNYPTLGWGLVYRINNDRQVASSLNKKIDQVNQNNGTVGDKKGWNGRMSMIRVERDENIIRIYASPFSTNISSLAIDPASKIEINLDDPASPYKIFAGPQYYGYGIQSQADSEFLNIEFGTTTDVKFLYDLKEDKVYEQKSTGGYVLRPDLKALDEIGYPRYVGNVETQSRFRLRPERYVIQVH